MNMYVKEFLKRGFMFSGLGPVVLAIVYLCLGEFTENFSLTGTEVFWSIISVYLLAFLHAGASVFNQIDHWPIGKSLFCHFFTLYIAYSVCYVFNSWIPFEPKVLSIFTLIFVVGYFLVWGTVYLCVRKTGNRFNAKLK